MNELISLKSFKRLRKNKIAVAGLSVISCLICLSFFGYMIAQDRSQNANNQSISIKLLHPGTEMNFVVFEKQNSHRSFMDEMFGSQVVEETIPVDSFYRSHDTVFYKKFKQPFWSQTVEKVKIVQRTFYLGTDNLGRDVLSRLIIGTRISMAVGFIAVIISLILGSILGLLAGYFGGVIDRAIMWSINVFWAIPTILFAMVLLIGFRGESKFQILVVFLAVGFTMWVDTARLVRGLVIQLKERPFIEATRALGFSHWRIIFKHIFPNTFSTLIVITASNFASAILIESGLSYMGLGVQPPTPSWGSMLREYYNYIGTDVSYLAVFPGLCIMLSVLAFYALGNGLRDALDVRD